MPWVKTGEFGCCVLKRCSTTPPPATACDVSFSHLRQWNALVLITVVDQHMQPR